MKPKKTAAALFAVLLCLSLCLTASAAEWEEEDFTFTVPEEFVYSFHQGTPVSDASWALAGISDPSSQLQEYQERGILADLYTEDGACMKVQRQDNATTESIYNLKELTEEERTAFLENQTDLQDDRLKVSSGYIDVDGQPFFYRRLDGDLEQGEAHELQYGTVFNGHSISFATYAEGKPLPQEWVDLLESTVSTVKLTNVLEKPEPEPVNVALLLSLLGLIVVIIVAPFVYIPIRNKLDKKRKEAMAERLSEYRKTYGEEDSLGSVRFVNETDCTKEAVHTFSLYHSYGKNLATLLLGGAMCMAAIAAVFLFDLTWWLKLLAVGAGVYYAFKAFNMGNAVEKVQRKVFSRGVSSTARYTFYDNGFRVAGIQSASIYPYFQITGLRRHGHYLYLYYGPDNAYLIDQYGFSQGEFEDFLKFIREKTTSKKEEK